MCQHTFHLNLEQITHVLLCIFWLFTWKNLLISSAFLFLYFVHVEMILKIVLSLSAKDSKNRWRVSSAFTASCFFISVYISVYRILLEWPSSSSFSFLSVNCFTQISKISLSVCSLAAATSSSICTKSSTDGLTYWFLST